MRLRAPEFAGAVLDITQIVWLGAATDRGGAVIRSSGSCREISASSSSMANSR
jgi:hypothetical protein